MAIILQHKNISTEYLIKHLSKYSFFYNRLNNKKLNSISKEYILNNPIKIYNSKYGIDIVDGRHRLYMAIAVYHMDTIPFIIEEGFL